MTRQEALSEPTGSNAPSNTPHDDLLRKLLHIGTGGGALLLRWTGWWGALLLAGVGVLFNGFLLHRVTGGRLLRRGEQEAGWSRGVLAYPTMILLLVVVLPGRLELVAAAWGMLALGDGAAGLLGPRIGGPALPWNAGKSWAGLGAFTVVAFPSAMFLIRWTQGGGAPGVGDAFGGSNTWLLLGCFAAAFAAGVAESLDSEVDDNIRVPLAGVGALLVAAAIDPGVHSAWTTALQPPFPGLLLLLAPAAAAWGVKAVSLSGALGGWVLVAGLYTFSGWPAVFAFGAFFVVGTGATRLGGRRKRDLGVAQEDGGRRGASHAAANAGAGLLFAFLTAFGGAPELFSLAMVASFATAAFDTASSEVGQAFGRHHVLVTSVRRVPPGTEGAVSMEGTLGGLAGGAVVAVTAFAAGLVDGPGAAFVLGGATVGGMVESAVGTWLPRQGPADNGLLNCGATLVGAGCAVALSLALG